MAYRSNPNSVTAPKFSLDIQKWIEKAQGRADLVVRKASLQMFSDIVLMSPVGNPELWAANAHAKYGRETHNMFAEAFNADLMANPENLTKSGRLKKGIKKARKLGKKKLKQVFKYKAGKGYVGGRFRGNWQIGLNTRPNSQLNRIDASGDATIAAAEPIIFRASVGNSIWFANNLPYAMPLEYGWSKQAPGGMVRITAARWQMRVNESVKAAVQEIP